LVITSGEDESIPYDVKECIKKLWYSGTDHSIFGSGNVVRVVDYII